MSRQPWLGGLRARLSVSIAVILLAAVGVTFLVIYRGTGNSLRSKVDSELRTEADAFTGQGLANAHDPDALAREARRYVRTQGFGPSARLLILRLADGRTATNYPELLGLRRDPDHESGGTQSQENAQARRLLSTPIGFSTVELQDIGPVRVITRPILRAGSPVGTVRVGEPLAPVERAEDGVVDAFVLAGSITLLAALLAGYFVAARTADPLRRMSGIAAAIDAGDLSRRIGPSGPSEEVRTLAHSFDHMLDRLDDAFARQREFVSDASHELRTPLTVVRGQLEVLVRSEKISSSDVQRVEAIVSKEVARMQRMVDDLLALARAGEGGEPDLEEVNVHDLLREQLESVRPTAERDFTLGPADGGTVRADVHGITQVIRNLLRNAVEHTGRGGRVRMSAEPRGDRIVFSVDDDGPGIPAAERARVFERFHRVGSARGEGGGLGLAIAQAVVEAHGGSIWAEESDLGGARVAFELPRG